jgi:glutathione S-transferase
MKLIVSNKPYSPWPFRSWLLMKVKGIPFEEEMVDLSAPDKVERLKAVSPSGRVPVLIDGPITVWESSAIAEYLAEKLPQLGIWPQDTVARAHARSISEEMHAGFTALRGRLVMNMRREGKPSALDEPVLKDIRRITDIWVQTRQRFSAGGDFLYGDFTAADAAYAPIVSRFISYDVIVSEEARRYMAAIRGLPAWAEWRAACDRDPWHNTKTDSIA